MPPTPPRNANQVTRLTRGSFHGFEAQWRPILASIVLIFVLSTALTLLDRSKGVGLGSPDSRGDSRGQSKIQDAPGDGKTFESNGSTTKDGMHVRSQHAPPDSTTEESVPRGDDGVPQAGSKDTLDQFEERFAQRMFDGVEELLALAVRTASKNIKLESEQRRRTGSEPGASVHNDTQHSEKDETTPRSGRGPDGRDASGYGTEANAPSGRDRNTSMPPELSGKSGEKHTDEMTNEGCERDFIPFHRALAT